MLLLCALLNRLGYSDIEFDFFGTPDEENYNSITPYLSGSSSYHSSNYLQHLEKLKKLGETHPLMMQSYHLYSASTKDTIEDNLQELFKAMRITLPDFSIAKIRDYLLSSDEISILMSINCVLTN